MQSTTDIPIEYINATYNTDFEVVVFTKNFNYNTPRVYYVAWQVLRSQTSAQFVYPLSMSVGATYYSQGQRITVGPFPTRPGSTWEITQESMGSTAELKEVQGVPANPNGSIVIRNQPPMIWRGRMFNVGVYKDSRLLVAQPDVHIGSQVEFMLQPKLYFGVVRNMKTGDTFTSLEITSSLEMFDLSEFPNGLVVTLSQELGGGQYRFTGKAM